MSKQVKFRTERVKDVILFVHQLSHTERASMEVEFATSGGDVTDVEVTMTLDRNTIEDVRRYMSTVEDGRVMVETLKPAAEYDGERDAVDKPVRRDRGLPPKVMTMAYIGAGKQKEQIDTMFTKLEAGGRVHLATTRIDSFALDFRFQTGYVLNYEEIDHEQYMLSLGQKAGVTVITEPRPVLRSYGEETP